jgi:hypothetical protein
MDHVPQLVGAAPTDLDDQLWHAGTILVKSRAQYLEGIPIGVAGVKPVHSLHGRAGNAYAVLERDLFIAKSSSAINVRWQVRKPL